MFPQYKICTGNTSHCKHHLHCTTLKMEQISHLCLTLSHLPLVFLTNLLNTACHMCSPSQRWVHCSGEARSYSNIRTQAPLGQCASLRACKRLGHHPLKKWLMVELAPSCSRERDYVRLYIWEQNTSQPGDFTAATERGLLLGAAQGVPFCKAQKAWVGI